MGDALRVPFIVSCIVYDISVFENLRFGPSKGKRASGVSKPLHSGDRF